MFLKTNKQNYLKNCKKRKKYQKFIEKLVSPNKECKDFYEYYNKKTIQCRRLLYSFKNEKLTRGVIKDIFRGKEVDLAFNYEYLIVKPRQEQMFSSINSWTSGASLDMTKYKSFIFGGFSSIFWLCKEYINEQDLKHGQDLPDDMLCWNMISIVLTDRTYDFIITDEAEMDMLIVYLLKERVKPGDMWKALRFYRLLRIRMKISYSAFQRRLPVSETFLRTIIDTYQKLNLDESRRPMNMEILLDKQPFRRALKIMCKSLKLDKAIRQGNENDMAKYRKQLAHQDKERLKR